MIFIRRYLLFPFSILYNIITSIRNLLFDFGILKQTILNHFSIGVGNITVGGTGKTPFVDFLINNLKYVNKAVISRGYGRSTNGFIAIDYNKTAKDVGDEPKMLYDSNANKAQFFVSEKRLIGYQKALDISPNIDLFIFDDVFQHRHIEPQCMILLVDYTRPIFNDYLLPAGNLRESRIGAKRADIVLVTKIPAGLPQILKQEFSNRIKKYLKPKTPIFYSYFQFSKPQNIKNEYLKVGDKVVLLSGLANNQQFFEFQKESFSIMKHYKFSDHFNYSKNVLFDILIKNVNYSIITTQKDFVKIKNLLPHKELNKFFVVNSSICVEDKADFLETIIRFDN